MKAEKDWLFWGTAPITVWVVDFHSSIQITQFEWLLRSAVNCTAYPIQALCDPFIQKEAVGVKGLV